MNDREKEIEKVAESIISPKADPITTFCIGADWADANPREYIKNELASYATLRPLYAETKIENIKLKDELKSNDKSFGLVVSMVEEIMQLVYPDVERCECEGACSCQYPEGWVKLQQLKYHAMGASIGIEEALGDRERA